LRTQALHNVDRDERGATVQCCSHTAHERRGQCGGDKAAHAYRYEIANEKRQHGVIVGSARPGHGGQLDRSLLPEHVAQYSGKHHQEDGSELEESGKQCSVLPVFQRVRAKDALHVRLVGAPVPNAENGIAEQDRQPGELVQMPLAVDDRLQHVHLPGSDRLIKGRQIMDADPRQRLDAQNGDQRGSSQQQHYLDIFRHHYCFQATKGGIGHSEQRKNNDGGKHGHAQQGDKHLGRGKQADADVDEERPGDTDHSQKSASLRTITPLHKLGQRGYTRVDVEGREHQSQQDQDEAGHPFEVAHHQAVARTPGSVTHQVNGGDV
jgi:hypothetical protein